MLTFSLSHQRPKGALTLQNVNRIPVPELGLTYGTMYGMVKTTVYLPEDLKASLERVAAERGRSEAELIREAIRALVGDGAPAKPKVPLVAAPLGDATASERVEDLLDGFGAG